MTTYSDHGYEDRIDYLRHLADDNSASIETVLELASLLGEEEDFDLLVTHVHQLTGHPL